ncbi:ribbon-helix-helix protein, CopG family [Corynebacterium mastitidis]|nr:ribbon-helix-helix protein, CopG family [Corynebacterium mastitidis]
MRLPDELNARLDAYAKAQGLSPSEVMREALQKYLPASAA